MRVWAKAGSAILGVVMAGCLAFGAQQPTPMPDAELSKEAATAQSMYQAQNMVGALPLYEDLHKRQPDSNLWRERLAMCLLGAAVNRPADELLAARDRARQLLLDAKAAGDNSNLLQVMLEKLSAPVSTAPAGPPSPGMETFQRAEKAFSSGDLPGALKAYQEAMAADPKMYEAPLYAGDTE
jgi:thioredoxin-like negative regulator of GroEL